MEGNFISCKQLAQRVATACHPGPIVTSASPSLLQVTGALDVATKDLLQSVVDQLPSPELHVDLARREFADAAGLAVLARRGNVCY